MYAEHRDQAGYMTDDQIHSMQAAGPPELDRPVIVAFQDGIKTGDDMMEAFATLDAYQQETCS